MYRSWSTVASVGGKCSEKTSWLGPVIGSLRVGMPLRVQPRVPVPGSRPITMIGLSGGGVSLLVVDAGARVGFVSCSRAVVGVRLGDLVAEHLQAPGDRQPFVDFWGGVAHGEHGSDSLGRAVTGDECA